MEESVQIVTHPRVILTANLQFHLFINQIVNKYKGNKEELIEYFI